MTQWQAEKRTEYTKAFGPYLMVPERNSNNETAYLVSFPDGRMVRVLPDDRHSAQRRSRVIVTALTALELAWGSDTGAGDSLPSQVDMSWFLIGAVAAAGLTWEMVDTTDPLGDFLTKWFVDINPDDPDIVKFLLDDLDHAGWTIVSKGDA
jgi:hypothetical protein